MISLTLISMVAVAMFLVAFVAYFLLLAHGQREKEGEGDDEWEK